MITSALNNLIVQVEHKYIGNISSILKMAAIQNLSSVDPADYVNIIGKVISLPKKISDKKEYQGFSIKDIQVGDMAIFRFDVIYDLIQKEDIEEPIYRNMLWYNAQEYFISDITKIFGVIRNGEILMVNGYVMVEKFEESKIVMPQHLKKIKAAQSTKIMHIGSPRTDRKKANAAQGDMVYFNPFQAQHYQINNKPFCIITQDKILGKVVE